MSYLPMSVQLVIDERTSKLVDEATRSEDPTAMDRATGAVRREMDWAKEAVTIVEALGKLAMGSGSRDYLAAALSSEHRTILGQIARAVGTGIVKTTDSKHQCVLAAPFARHHSHDGRLTCETIAGAIAIAGQPLI